MRGELAGPIAWRFITLASRQPASLASEVIPAFSSARFAGALRLGIKCESLSRNSSHFGQVGQSLLFVYLWPLAQVRAVPLRFVILSFRHGRLHPHVSAFVLLPIGKAVHLPARSRAPETMLIGPPGFP